MASTFIFYYSSNTFENLAKIVGYFFAMRHLSNDKHLALHLSYLCKGRVSVETPPEAPSLHQPSPSLCCAESSPASASESLQTAQTHTQCGTICEISKPSLYAAIYVLPRVFTLYRHTVWNNFFDFFGCDLPCTGLLPL